MATITRFEDLRCWQAARVLFRLFCEEARRGRLAADRVVYDQMRRSSLSVGSNIAEGYERGTRKQQIQFCFMAKGSAAEFRSQLIMAHDVGLLDDEPFDRLWEVTMGCSRQLGGYIRWLQKSSQQMPRMEYETD